MPNIPIKPKFAARRVAFNIIEDRFNPTSLFPTLYMHINPTSMGTGYQKKIHRYQTFTAQVEEHYGDELDTISCSGSTGGFILEEFGLTTAERSYSKPYFKFQDVLDVYRNNGAIYDATGQIIKKGQVVMYYDPGTYYGFFEIFNYAEDALSPFRFTFDFVFKVEKSYTGV